MEIELRISDTQSDILHSKQASINVAKNCLPGKHALYSVIPLFTTGETVTQLLIKPVTQQLGMANFSGPAFEDQLLLSPYYAV